MSDQTPPQAPAAPYPGTPAQPPAPKRSWFARHKFLTGLGVVVAVVVIASAASGGGGDAPDDATGAAGSSAPSSSAQTSDTATGGAKVAEKKVKKKDDKKATEKKSAGIGDPVRDGKFEFTVTSVKDGVASVGDDVLGQEAQGQFVLVKVTVKNIGDKAQLFDGSSQTAFDADGREFSSDSEAAIYVKGSESFLNEINPGNSVKATVVFDVPKGAKLTKVELHDSVFSGGVDVAL